MIERPCLDDVLVQLRKRKNDADKGVAKIDDEQGMLRQALDTARDAPGDVDPISSFDEGVQ